MFVTDDDQVVAYRDDEFTLEQNFNRYHRENPQVYRMMVRLAREWRRRRGDQPCGIGMLFETARWHLNTAGDGEPLALNNNYRAFYARLIMDTEPDLAGIFELRRQRYDREAFNEDD